MRRLRASTALRAAARSAGDGPESLLATALLAAAARLVVDFAAGEGRLAAGFLAGCFLAGAGRLAAGFLAAGFLAAGRLTTDAVGRTGRLAVDFLLRDGAGGVTCPAFFRRAAAALA
jgi:hypothetical protein